MYNYVEFVKLQQHGLLAHHNILFEVRVTATKPWTLDEHLEALFSQCSSSVDK